MNNNNETILFIYKIIKIPKKLISVLNELTFNIVKKYEVTIQCLF